MRMTPTEVILFGTGSPLLGDVEESLFRARVPIGGGVRNRPGPNYLADGTLSWCAEDVPASVLALPFLIPIFTPGYRQQAMREATGIGFQHPFTLIDPSVPAPRRLEIGPGTYINSGCSLGPGSVFGPYVLINRGASIGHHVKMDAFVSVGPGVVVAGLVTIGTGCVIGAGATILPEITIGDNAVVGAGSVVTRDVPAGCRVIGNPARVVRDVTGGYRGVTVT
jgi:sugar O-acyltransferase (sialic acid O-acetyltransferase NeuD family)